MKEIILVIIVCTTVAFVFVIVGFLYAMYLAFRETYQTIETIYCFECEIEMPAKEKNGRLYCTNCKLYHGPV